MTQPSPHPALRPGPPPSNWTYSGGPGYPPRPAPPPLSPAGQPLASFGDRLLAYLVDTAIFMVVGFVLTIPIMLVWFALLSDSMVDVYRTVDPDGTMQVDLDLAFTEFVLPLLLLEAGLVVALLVLYYIYFVEMMLRTGQTVGKRLLKLRTVPLDPAATLTRGMAARRYLVQFGAGMLVPGFACLDGLWQLWDKPYQQCLHDKFARTLVVKVPG